MTLIKSISGIRGTIGGKVGDNLTPVDAVKFASAYGTWLKDYSKKEKLTVVVGRDARISGPMIHNLVVNTLVGLGIDVIDLGLSTTPTVEVAVPLEKAGRSDDIAFSYLGPDYEKIGGDRIYKNHSSIAAIKSFLKEHNIKVKVL